MIKIGITGGIGSGKSTVCKVFELLRIPVYYADEEAKKLLDNDPVIKKNILAVFGNEVLNESGYMDRKKISSIVFKDQKKLEQLNSIIHPAVALHFSNWLKHYSSHKYIVKEAAVLFESDAYKQINKAITVIAPEELRIKRVMQRDSITLDQVTQRMRHQMSDEEKIKRSSYIIHNDEKQLIIPQVVAIHDQLSK
ncbi:MAG: dephospho-CoA kinase [Bacteroidota bacterium]